MNTIVGLRIECPWCASSVRADMLDVHLWEDHRLSPIEADEICDRLRVALEERPKAQAVMWAFTGIEMPAWDARRAISDMRTDTINARQQRRSRHWNTWGRHRPDMSRLVIPDGHRLCYACSRVVPVGDMVRKPDGEPGSICRKCRREVFSFTIPAKTGGNYARLA